MSETKPSDSSRSRLRGGLRRLRASVANAKEILEFGRLGDPWGSPYAVVHEGRHYRLRRYASIHSEGRPTQSSARAHDQRLRAPLLLVPPLMVTSEVYDVAPDISAVCALTAAGLDVWLVDFGAPEREDGGLERTLDDHVLAVDDAISRIRAATGYAVHLVGYSQGGMFCYQAAAYRRGQDIASLVTFGSPVDIHRNLPAVDADIGARVIGLARKAIAKPLEQVDGLPGFLTSTGFKLLSLRKELAQISEFLGKLHDRDALIKRESRRRFLAGEGFVAWPGPALRTFIDEFIVANRLSSGGFVIAGRTVTLADLTMPILYFVGERDDIARAASVRPIVQAAPQAETFEVALPVGHFGLVVGTTAMTKTWPTVVQWVRWREQAGPRPSALPDPERVRAQAERARREWDEVEALDVEADFDPIVDVLGGMVGNLLDRVERTGRELGESFDDFRYQLPRLRTLEQLGADTRINLGLELSAKAARHPERTFFLWRGRAFSYADADRRVDAIVRGLIASGLRSGQRIGVLMEGRPSYLSLVTAIARLGGVAVLFKPVPRELGEAAVDSSTELEAQREAIRRAIADARLAALICDPPNVGDALAVWTEQARREAVHERVLVLGGGPADERGGQGARGRRRAWPAEVVDLEAIDPSDVELPAWYVPNPGRAGDLALVIVTARAWAPARESWISHGRWAVSAYGAAATCLLSSRDTVFCMLPLHHPAGMLVTVGGALVGGARLALAPTGTARLQPGRDADAHGFWTEIRRTGATVLFHAGEMCRALVDAPRSPAEGNHPLRLIAGSGMRPDLWRRLQERLGPLSIREFYASTEGKLVLANVGNKPGSLGRPLPGSNELAVVAYDFDADDFVRDAQGFARRCRVDEAGLLIARMDRTHAGAHERRTHAGEDGRVADVVRRSVFTRDDSWFVTGDIVRRDAEGDYWLIDRTEHLIRGPHGWVASREIEDALYRVPGVRLVVVYGLEQAQLPASSLASGESHERAQIVVAAVVGSPTPEQLAAAVAELRPEQRPRFVLRRDWLPLTDGFRPLKTPMRRAGLDPNDPTALHLDGAGRYVPLVAAAE